MMPAAGHSQAFGGAAIGPRLRLAAAVSGLAALAACAPALVPVDQAERSCAADLRAPALRSDPRVSMGVAVGSSGRVRPHAGLSVSMTPDRAVPIDKSAAFEQCVIRRSGQGPTRPLSEQPGFVVVRP